MGVPNLIQPTVARFLTNGAKMLRDVGWLLDSMIERRCLLLKVGQPEALFYLQQDVGWFCGAQARVHV